MASQRDLDEIYMQTALLHSKLSRANRKHVGAVLVTKQGVTLTGFNGTAAGLPNACEDASGNTLLHVIHAELNCVLKAAKEGISVVDSTMYITLSPCQQCAGMLIQAGVNRVVYLEQYRCTDGIALLEQSGVRVEKFITNERINIWNH